MHIRASSPFAEPFDAPATVTRHHPHACFGRDVLVLLTPEGGAVGPVEAEFAGYEVVDATDEERRRLLAAGYRLRGLVREDCLAHA
jgi:hypothetical protein